MATEVLMPQMGESIAEGTITKWLVQHGDTVERDQPLFEITTDKVDAEVPSPVAGTVIEIRYPEGETVEVDTVVALIATTEAELTQARATDLGPQDRAPAPQPDADSLPAGPPPAGPPPAGPVAVPAAATSAPVGLATTPSPAERGQVVSFDERLRRFSSPLVRSIAAKEGVDLTEVEGTGVRGRVTKRDILAYLERRKAQPEVPAAAPAKSPPAVGAPLTASPIPDFKVPAYGEGEDVVIEPMSQIRRITAAHMLYSKATSAHVTTVFHMDMSRVVKVRNRAKEGFARDHDTKLTYMPFIFQAVVSALRTHSKFNASVDGSDVVLKRDINLGMAVALDRGLLVPVIRNADRLSLIGLATTANDLAERARTKKLKPHEVQGGTFTVTNPGVFGSLFGTPIINQPQVAILCIGAIEKRPVVVTDADGNDSLAIKSMSYFALTYDHRLIDGADAERFLLDIKTSLGTGEWPELLAYL